MENDGTEKEGRNFHEFMDEMRKAANETKNKPGIVPVEKLVPGKIVKAKDGIGWTIVPDNRVKRPDGSTWDPDTGIIEYPDGRLEHDLVYRRGNGNQSRQKEKKNDD